MGGPALRPFQLQYRARVWVRRRVDEAHELHQLLRGRARSSDAGASDRASGAVLRTTTLPLAGAECEGPRPRSAGSRNALTASSCVCMVISLHTASARPTHGPAELVRAFADSCTSCSNWQGCTHSHRYEFAPLPPALTVLRCNIPCRAGYRASRDTVPPGYCCCAR